MKVWSVISRELRAQSHQHFTYWMRTLGVAALLLVGLLFLSRYLFSNDGENLFALLHFTLFCAIWILVPLSAADCISRERREGTLGLLFLTPLRPWEIVVAKFIAHGLRAVTLLVAVLPVLTIPFLIGGVPWGLATVSALIHVNSICWTLAATLTASALSRNAWRALVGAVLLTAVALFFASYLMCLVGFVLLSKTGSISSDVDLFSFETVKWGFSATAMYEDAWTELFTLGITPAQWVFAIAVLTGISFLVLLGSVLLAAWRMSRNWREEPPPVWVRQTQHAFLKPVIWKKFLSRWLRWQLNRNPLGWLERRHWLSRLISWTWLAITAVVTSFALTNDSFFTDHGFLVTVAWMMMGSLAVCVAGSFRRERESGALELLLVTPLTVSQIIAGRLKGLWGQFFPAVGLFLGMWIYFGSLLRPSAWPLTTYFAMLFVTLPVIGLYFSVRCRTYLGALLSTIMFSVLAPLFLPLVQEHIETISTPPPLYSFYTHRSYYSPYWPWRLHKVIPYQLIFTAWFGFLLYRRLKRRDFSS